MIEAVILDFGGVLFKNKPKEDWVGLKSELDIDPNLWDKAGLGLVSDEYIFDLLGKKYGVSAGEIGQWLLSRREPNRELLSLLGKLNPKIKRAVINNGMQTLFREYLKKYDLSSNFDALINSAEEGVKKPDPKIYLDTCKKLGVKPEDCLFIDDDEKNLEGAKNVGMKVLLFGKVTKLADEFKKLGLL